LSDASFKLLERLIDLETRIAFMERTLIEMSDALADARRDSARDRTRIDRVLYDLGELRGLIPGDTQEEPPPPHY
jgi:SlyX protein